MCGIAGVLWRDARPVEHSSALLERMRDALRHRGPDDAGIHVCGSGRIGLANTRLAIRDLSPAGHMPMRSPDGTLCITYNGEVYNAEALREDLRRLGYSFRSTSDTEVVLAGYQYWGDDVVRRLRGMFAFAIADEASSTLLLARDPLGIKPLYYSASAEAFAFASEIQALVAGTFARTDIDASALAAYLQLGSVPAPLTMLADVAALAPGCTLRVGGDLRARERSYYEMPAPGSDSDEPAVLASLRDAVTSHLVADVPVGAFLSGGLDSSAVVALAAERLPHLTTCTIRFNEASADESAFARALAAHCGTEHHEFTVTATDVVNSIDRIIGAIDQPSIDGLNTFFIAQAAAQAGLKVVLSGLGGDELFGGYPSFNGVPRVMRAVRSARVLAAGNVAARAVQRLSRGDRWQKVADAVRRPTSRESAFLTFRGLFAASETATLLGGASTFDAVAYVRTRASGNGDVGDWVSRAELRTYTANQLLRDADVMSMAHSLELRVPLLDTRLVERMLALPARVRFAGKGNKPLLRAAVAGLLPDVVRARRAKRGFMFPMGEWLASPAAAPLWDWQGGIWDSLDPAAVASVRERFRAGHAHWSRPWSLMVLNEWHKRLRHV